MKNYRRQAFLLNDDVKWYEASAGQSIATVRCFQGTRFSAKEQAWPIVPVLTQIAVVVSLHRNVGHLTIIFAPRPNTTICDCSHCKHGQWLSHSRSHHRMDLILTDVMAVWWGPRMNLILSCYGCVVGTHNGHHPHCCYGYVVGTHNGPHPHCCYGYVVGTHNGPHPHCCYVKAMWWESRMDLILSAVKAVWWGPRMDLILTVVMAVWRDPEWTWSSLMLWLCGGDPEWTWS